MSLLTIPVHVLSSVIDPAGDLLLVTELSQLQETLAEGRPPTELQVKLNGSPSYRILGMLDITGSDGGSIIIIIVIKYHTKIKLNRFRSEKP